MASDNEFWLEQWMSEFDIVSTRDYWRACKSPTVVQRLFELMSAVDYEDALQADKLDSRSVLAGRSLDISGTFSLSCYVCMSFELDVLFSRTMHYFDKVVVGGPPADYFSVQIQSSEKHNRRSAFQELEAHVKLLLDISEIGARDRVRYINKPTHVCENCTRTIAAKVGFSFYDDEAQKREIIAKIVADSKMTFMRDRAGAWVVSIRHPLIPGNGTWETKFGRHRPNRAKAAERLFPVLTDPYVQDFDVSEKFRLPLINAYQASWVDRQDSGGFTADQTALHFELPAVQGLSLRDHISFQNDHREHYVRFQAAIRGAVREYLSRQDLENPQTTAKAIVDEVVTPELARIDAQLKAAKRNLSAKASGAMFIGTTVASAGILAAMPLMVATGVAAAASSLTQLYKYVDDRSSIESSDMYYLWKLDRLAHK